MNRTSANASGWPKILSRIMTVPRGFGSRSNGFGCLGHFAGTKRRKKINHSGLRRATTTQRLPTKSARLRLIVTNVRFGSKADMCSATRDVRFVPIADIGHSIGLSVFCKFFCATDYLHSNLLSPFIVNILGFLSERLDIDRLGAGHLHLVDFF